MGLYPPCGARFFRMATDLSVTHLAKFKECLDNSDRKFLGRMPKGWGESVAQREGIASFDDLPQIRQDRHDLHHWMESADESRLRDCCAAVFAWGGMKVDHGARVFEGFDKWKPVARELWRGNIDRGTAYESFRKLRSEGNLCGMGPAYFTKLIFFLGRRGCSQGGNRSFGYIMDQWTARSVNLLTCKSVVQFDSQYIRYKRDSSRIWIRRTVSDQNDQETYEYFCSIVEKLANEFQKSPEMIEEALFSAGGRPKGAWRDFVISMDKQL